MKLIYLHGFASGPMSSKAQFFRRRFEELGIEMRIPDLSEGNFEQLTISGQLRVIVRYRTPSGQAQFVLTTYLSAYA